MAESHVHPEPEETGGALDRDALVAELSELRERIDGLRSELDRTPSIDGSPAPAGPSGMPAVAIAQPGSTRRQLLQLAGASAVGVAGGAIMAGQPVAAADPNDVVKGVSNAVDDTTTLDGAFPGPVLSLFNRSGDADARGFYVFSEGALPTVRADNDRTTSDAVGVAGNAPAGRDLHAMGSGRIAMADHDYGGDNAYFAGEIHQSDGTFYAMVGDGFRRVLAAPTAAGALFPIDPIRVYDSRLPTPSFGRISAGQSRTVDINDSRDSGTGAIVQSGVVPEDATAIVYNLTAADTAGRGYLAVTPETNNDPDISTINWTTDGAAVANSSMVRLGVSSSVAVFCGGEGSTHFIVDIVGYYR